MPAESVSGIHDLVPTSPDGGEPIAEGDDHIRAIKASLKLTFPEFGEGGDSGTVTATADELSELSGLGRLPEAPAQDGSMLYSSGGKWIETGAILIDDSDDPSVTVGADINVLGTVSALSGSFDSLEVAGLPISALTEYGAGNGILIEPSFDGGRGQAIAMSGSYTGTFTADDVVATSDERKKEQITTAPSEVIAAIQGREWLWRESGEKGSGVIAQELEAAGLEHLVHTNDDGMKAVSYNGLFAYVIEELKSLRAAYERDCK